MKKSFGVRHHTENSPCFVLQPRDLFKTSVHVLIVGHCGSSVFTILFGVFRCHGDEAPFSMCHREFEFIRQQSEKRAVSLLLHFDPLALETPTGVFNQAALRKQAELSQDLETVADTEQVSTIIPKLF